MIRLEHVTKTFPETNTEVLSDLNFYMEPGELCFLKGKSGCGKTTMLRLLLRDILPDNGIICVNGKNLIEMNQKEVPYYRRKIGAIFQEHALIKDKNVFENVALTRYVAGVADKSLTLHVSHALRMVGMEKYYNCYPSQLSGGEQQKVAIARALVGNPILIIADEPTRNLDVENSRRIMQLLEDIHDILGITMLIATHDYEAIKGLPGRVFHLEDHHSI